MNRKIIFFDIDGTLLDHDKKIPASAKESVQQLQEDGHFVAIATGRAPFTFEDIREELGVSTYISLNGQYVVHEDEVVYKNPLNHDELERLAHLSREKDHPLVYVNHEGWEASVESHPHVTQAIESLKVEAALHYNPISHKANDKYQVLLFCEQQEEMRYMDALPQFDFIRWHDYSVDVLPKGGSKAIGIQKLIHHLEMDNNYAYAFGDGLNDREMLEFIPHSVAMGNAVEETKKVAKFVTKDVAEDGIYLGLKQVGLL